MHSEGTPGGLEMGENRAPLVPEGAEFLNLTTEPFSLTRGFTTGLAQRGSGRRTARPLRKTSPARPLPTLSGSPTPASTSGISDLDSGGHTDRLLQVTMDPEGDIRLALCPCLPGPLLPVPLLIAAISIPLSSLKTPLSLSSLLDLLPNPTAL